MPPFSAVRGGGRLYIQSPLTGLSENEMINEARLRTKHNRQRHQLKQLLSTAANGGAVVTTKDLQLACKLAKLDMAVSQPYETLGPDGFVASNFVAARDSLGTPRQVHWKGFASSIPYPMIHGPGDYPHELPYTRKQKNLLKEYEDLQKEQVAAAAQGQILEVKDDVKDEDLIYWHSTIKRLLETRFGEIRRAYRLIDQDNSGACDRGELKHMCASQAS